MKRCDQSYQRSWCDKLSLDPPWNSRGRRRRPYRPLTMMHGAAPQNCSIWLIEANCGVVGRTARGLEIWSILISRLGAALAFCWGKWREAALGWCPDDQSTGGCKRLDSTRDHHPTFPSNYDLLDSVGRSSPVRPLMRRTRDRGLTVRYRMSQSTSLVESGILASDRQRTRSENWLPKNLPLNSIQMPS